MLNKEVIDQCKHSVQYFLVLKSYVQMVSLHYIFYTYIGSILSHCYQLAKMFMETLFLSWVRIVMTIWPSCSQNSNNTTRQYIFLPDESTNAIIDTYKKKILH